MEETGISQKNIKTLSLAQIHLDRWSLPDIMHCAQFCLQWTYEGSQLWYAYRTKKHQGIATVLGIQNYPLYFSGQIITNRVFYFKASSPHLYFLLYKYQLAAVIEIDSWIEMQHCCERSYQILEKKESPLKIPMKHNNNVRDDSGNYLDVWKLETIFKFKKRSTEPLKWQRFTFQLGFLHQMLETWWKGTPTILRRTSMHQALWEAEQTLAWLLRAHS